MLAALLVFAALTVSAPCAPASNQERALVFERDALGRIVKEKQAEHWVASEYDVLGLRTQVRSSFGAEVAITRNAMGDVTSVVDQGGFAAHFERDKLGLELSRSLPGGVKSRWQRDKLGRPVQHTVTSGEQTLRALGYKWEVNDRLRMVIDALEGPSEYRHDTLGNLAWGRYADGKSELRMPDAVGNLFKREDRTDRRYGPAGELLAQSTNRGEIHYRYDPEGNLLEKHEPNGRLWRYAWNGAGMLKSVRRPDGSEVTFGYDALGRRVRKTYRGQTTWWLWDGNVPLHEWVTGTLQSLEKAGGAPTVSTDASSRRYGARERASARRSGTANCGRCFPPLPLLEWSVLAGPLVIVQAPSSMSRPLIRSPFMAKRNRRRP